MNGVLSLVHKPWVLIQRFFVTVEPLFRNGPKHQSKTTNNAIEHKLPEKCSVSAMSVCIRFCKKIIQNLFEIERINLIYMSLVLIKTCVLLAVNLVV